MPTSRLGTAELLFNCAQQMGLQPVWLMPNGAFAITVYGREEYIHFGRSPLNSHVSSSLAKDKYLTRLILERNQIPNIPFARPYTQDQAQTFLKSYSTIVAKPTRGSGSRNIHVITTSEQLQALTITAYILEQYIEGKEMRYLVLNGAVIGVYQSEYGTSVQASRALQCIAAAPEAWDPGISDLAIQAAAALNLKFAAVDFLIDSSGRAYILEINTAPDLKWFHTPSAGPAVNVALQFLEAIVDDLRPRYAANYPLAIPTPHGLRLQPRLLEQSA